MSETTESTGKKGFDFNKILENAKLFLVRTAKSDFQVEHATEEEKQALATARVPITGHLSQDYAAWRRGLLWIALVLIGIRFVFELIDWIGDVLGMEGSGSPVTVAQILGTILFLIVPVSGVFLFFATQKWTDLKRSRKHARTAYLIMLVTPFVLSVVPWASLAGAKGGQVQALGSLYGAWLFIFVAPATIALCAGVVRSSMVIKTLVPESPSPGWAAVLFGPIFVLILLALTVFVNQIGGSLLLLAALVCIMLAPLVFILKADQVVRGHTEEEVTKVIGPIRKTYLGLMLAGLVLLVIWFFDDAGGDFVLFIRLIASFAFSFLLLTVVASDFILALLHNSFVRAKEYFASDLATSLEQKFEALGSVGLTKMKLSYATQEISQADLPEELKKAIAEASKDEPEEEKGE
jgi:hypothetical protein